MSSSTKQKKISWRTLPSINIDVGRDTSLGSRKFSKARVDCCLVRSCSKWGTVTKPSPQDVGLLFLKMTIYQPLDCRMRLVEAGTVFGRKIPDMTGDGPYISVAHPDQICGQPWQESVETQYEINPHAEAAGFTGDLGSFSQARASERQYRWNFTLQRHSGTDGEYTKLAWKWEGQKKGTSVAFERPIHAAVVVGHDKSPFTIRTYITGKFESRIQGWRNLMVNRAEGQVVSLEPDLTAPLQDLTTTIQGLQQSIEEKNKGQAPLGKLLQMFISVAALTGA